MELTYDTVREPYRSLHVPTAVARAIATPRELVLRKVRLLQPIAGPAACQQQGWDLLPGTCLGRHICDQEQAC